MMYDYETMRPEIFTDSGYEMLRAIRVNLFRIKEDSFDFRKITKGITGDSWKMLACIDYLEETCEITLYSNYGMRQDWLYKKN